jgi:translation initiation factor 1
MNQRLVYDSDAPLAKPPRSAKRQPEPVRPALKLPRDGVVRLLRDRKGRGGKTVTLVAGLPAGTVLESLARDLKRLCGTGGTVRDGLIEIQGDVRERIKPELERRGYTVKIAGG